MPASVYTNRGYSRQYIRVHKLLVGDAFDGRLAQIQLALIRLPDIFVYQPPPKVYAPYISRISRILAMYASQPAYT